MTNDHQTEAVIAAFAGHGAAEDAIKTLTKDGFDIKQLSVVGKGYHSEEKPLGFYNTGDRVKFWGTRGAFWGGLWGLFFGGVFITVPVIGPVVVVGYLASIVAAAIESAVLVGGLSAIGAALYSIGIPKDSVIKYDELIKADKFLVTVHGTAEQINRAKRTLEVSGSLSVDVHSGLHGSQDMAA